MSSVKVEGAGRFDGEYDLGDNDRVFTAREWHWIKKISGYMPMTISEGFAGQDPDLFIALAVIAMVRSRKVRREVALEVADEMSDAPYTASMITLVGDDLEAEDDDEVPPSSESGNDGPSPSVSLSNDATKKQNGHSSGTPSKTDSGQSVETLSPTTT